MSNFTTEQSCARELNRADELAAYREHFHLPADKNGQPCIYFCGNSLGLQPKAASDYVMQELQDWANLGVEGHFEAKHPWLAYHKLLTEQTARLVGARPAEVVTMNTLTVNLHLMMVSFYRPAARKYKILMEANAFPSDQYAVQSQVRFHGYDPDDAIIEIAPRAGESYVRTEDVETLLEQQGETIALVMLGGVNYYNGQVFDMARITQAAHKQGCLVGYDLAHAVGNIELSLHDWQVDFAVWCTYKYLNAGPGCVGGCFVHERHAKRTDLPRFAGWWGHDKQTRFQMPPEFRPIPGAEGWQLSNPPILPLAALRASLEIFDRAGMAALRKKSEKLTGYLDYLLRKRCNDFVTILTPSDPKQRGCQLSLTLKDHGRLVYERLKQQNVICDWREPDVIRVAPVPLYNQFQEVYRFVEILRQVYKDT